MTLSRLGQFTCSVDSRDKRNSKLHTNNPSAANTNTTPFCKVKRSSIDWTSISLPHSGRYPSTYCPPRLTESNRYRSPQIRSICSLGLAEQMLSNAVKLVGPSLFDRKIQGSNASAIYHCSGSVSCGLSRSVSVAWPAFGSPRYAW